ncbi:hypothetical protein A2Z00_02780 [Candidatus Gottesmanbacteria bacterium RBG_13_45_10]|uniref:Uncharacterized protein n=1 Tax=Candidatus Gottesmanbacteria bacterium RBG_13_45_10 TaxID=1798370 RepID=A0A1F5ZGH2_9BACT|nr:MAG: hypothetical protein A2Z00_02780 [Candidatus Gottesmanbacteria bacterium RBG_13_45_10]
MAGEEIERQGERNELSPIGAEESALTPEVEIPDVGPDPHKQERSRFKGLGNFAGVLITAFAQGAKEPAPANVASVLQPQPGELSPAQEKWRGYLKMDVVGLAGTAYLMASAPGLDAKTILAKIVGRPTTAKEALLQGEIVPFPVETIELTPDSVTALTALKNVTPTPKGPPPTAVAVSYKRAEGPDINAFSADPTKAYVDGFGRILEKDQNFQDAYIRAAQRVAALAQTTTIDPSYFQINLRHYEKYAALLPALKDNLPDDVRKTISRWGIGSGTLFLFNEGGQAVAINPPGNNSIAIEHSADTIPGLKTTWGEALGSKTNGFAVIGVNPEGIVSYALLLDPSKKTDKNSGGFWGFFSTTGNMPVLAKSAEDVPKALEIAAAQIRYADTLSYYMRQGVSRLLVTGRPQFGQYEMRVNVYGAKRLPGVNAIELPDKVRALPATDELFADVLGTAFNDYLLKESGGQMGLDQFLAECAAAGVEPVIGFKQYKPHDKINPMESSDVIVPDEKNAYYVPLNLANLEVDIYIDRQHDSKENGGKQLPYASKDMMNRAFGSVVTTPDGKQHLVLSIQKSGGDALLHSSLVNFKNMFPTGEHPTGFALGFFTMVAMQRSFSNYLNMSALKGGFFQGMIGQHPDYHEGQKYDLTYYKGYVTSDQGDPIGNYVYPKKK